ncbi:MAG TPA: hypothetical protein VFX49_22005 [Chloroflexota bacterium]|nr:hypothetical protein [Chloroflexota bacterium]
MSSPRAARLVRANAELRRLLNLIDEPDSSALPAPAYAALLERASRWAEVVERLILEPGRARDTTHSDAPRAA